MNAMRHQWNDLYLMDGNKALFDQYVALFDDMKKDYEKAQPPFPPSAASRANGVACDDAVDFGTTVTFPSWSGRRTTRSSRSSTGSSASPRGRRPAGPHQARGQHAHDPRRTAATTSPTPTAEVRRGLPGPLQLRPGRRHHQGHPRRQDPRGRLPLRSTGFDYNPDNNDDVKNNPDDKLDLTLDYYSHQKFLIIQGNYAGNPNAQLVFTGSSNWGALGSVNDEILVAIQGKKVARQYLRQFNFEWRPGNSPQRLHDVVPPLPRPGRAPNGPTARRS